MATRSAGINIPVFSLRSKKSLGCGDFLDLLPFIDWAKKAGFKLIQILPVNDTAMTQTEKDRYPYAILSAFAFHPIYLNLPELDEELRFKKLRSSQFNYLKTYRTKRELLKKIFHKRGEKDLKAKDFALTDHLKTYAAFCTLRDHYKTADFRKWKEHSIYTKHLVEEICKLKEAQFYFFLQYHLDRQFRQMRSYAKENGIALKGDFPIGVHPHSAEAWRYCDYFRWDQSIGAPPDFYNSVGQNWGFPSYNWEKIREDNFSWFKERLAWMEQYFDLIRIDHILGYFRLWEIPRTQVRGLMGSFYPAKGYTEKELGEDPIRLCTPYGDPLPEHLNTQRKIKKQISDPKKRNKLYKQLENVCFFYRDRSYHPRVHCKETSSFKALNPKMKAKVLELHDTYFRDRQDKLWEKEGREKLTFIDSHTSLQICAEDIGVIPPCVEKVLKELKMLNLHVQRMPKSLKLEFEDPKDFPSTCVCTPSNHDTETLRQWWESDPQKTKRYFHQILRHKGTPPKKLNGELAQEILQAHLDSKAQWAIFLLQDLLAMSEELRPPNPSDERINDPAYTEGQWQWKMPLSIEDLLAAKEFTHQLRTMIQKAKR